MVAVFPVFATRALQVVPPSVEVSILYPVMAEPPLSAGGAQLRLICEEDTVVAESPFRGEAVTARVVAEAVLEEEPVPIELIAETL